MTQIKPLRISNMKTAPVEICERAQPAKVFIEKVHTDKDFAVSVANLKTQEETKTFDIKAGYDFSEAEFNEAVSILSDDEVGKVRIIGSIL